MAISDFNNDGFSDFTCHNANTGEVGYWRNSGGGIGAWVPQATLDYAEWHRIANGDYDADGFDDSLWFNGSTREIGIWDVDNGAVQSWTSFGTVPVG